MTSWLILLLPIGIAAWSFVSLRAQSRLLQDHWHHAADTLGLDFHPAPWWRAYPKLSGTLGGTPSRSSPGAGWA